MTSLNEFINRFSVILKALKSECQATAFLRSSKASSQRPAHALMAALQLKTFASTKCIDMKSNLDGKRKRKEKKRKEKQKKKKET